MSKLAIKPVWIVTLALLVALAVAIRLGFAITAFAPSNAPIGYVAQDEITNFSLKSGKETLFRPQYEREFWSGNLVSYPITEKGELTGATNWGDGAADVMDLQNFDTGRYIATMKDDGTTIPFRLTSLSAAQQSLFGNSAALVNFLRGQRINEGATYRTRKHVLGDIVHSRPYYVADATNPTVFASANDGMLHAVNASAGAGGGQERWAYVPSMLLSKMSNLSVKPYVHDYYVDGQINVATISSGTKRILVGALGGGGKGLYALNITGSAGLAATSESDVASKVMWEITPTKLNYASPTTANAFVNLGYTYGTVTLAKVGGVDAVILGNGYNDGIGSYSACSNATPNYTNCGGNYAAYLYVINASTGQLIKAIKAGSDGSAASPNGLSTVVAVDSNGDGSVDTAFAGDLNGTMWKFDLTGAGSATALLTTSPAQPITSTPGVALHPNGGYMVTFGTGRMLTSADLADTTVYYAYGIWDSAPVTNTALVSQTLTERSFTVGGVTTRVRSVTSNPPVWTSGALNHKGWKVALPAGERVVGEGSFIENGRFYFTGYNPTVSTTIPSTSSVVQGENWLMELDYLSGGSQNLPFLDLNGDVKLDNNDRIKYTATDVIPVTSPPTAVGDPILTTDGIAVGKFISIGVLSQPILVQLITLNDTLFNQNPDITVTTPVLQDGVTGGHFDQDIYYGSGTAGARATATITVGTTGQTSPFPATLGTIQVNGVTIVPALTVADIPDGTITATNAETIRSKVGGGFSATRSGSTVTVTAPVGASYNGAAFTINPGTAQALVPAVGIAAVAPTPGQLVITGVNQNRTVSIKCGAAYVGQPSSFTSLDDPDASLRLDDLFDSINSTTVNGYATSCVKTAPGGVTSKLTCTISAPAGASACSAGFTVDSNIQTSTNTGPAGGSNAGVSTPQSGWTNFQPALTSTAFSGGIDATVSGDTCAFFCNAKNHVHQYDKQYNVTGVNFLNPSLPAQALVKGVPSSSTQFKVLVQNQYLSPAVKMHIGNPSYLFDVDAGYIKLKDYQTTATLDLGTLPTYVNALVAIPPVLPIGSFAINMPVDALTAKNWWGNGDVRSGLQPSVYYCVKNSTGPTDGNMYQPVVPPANGIDGPGVNGWSGSTTPATATGVRHNGALTVQVIAANTPNSAIEQSVPGRPEYGWRVKSALFSTYVLVEFSTHWHHPNGKCYGDVGWTKTPPQDTAGVTVLSPKAAGSTDPLIGNLGGGGSSVVSVTTTVVGNVTTTVIVYANTLQATIVRTANTTNGKLDGSVTIVTTDTSGVATTQTIANTAGAVKSGGDERGLQARTGRISWRELVAP